MSAAEGQSQQNNSLMQSDDAAPPAENPWAHLDGEGGAGDDDDDIYG